MNKEEARKRRWETTDIILTIFVKKNGDISVFREADPALGMADGGGLLNKRQTDEFKKLMNYPEGGYKPVE